MACIAAAAKVTARVALLLPLQSADLVFAPVCPTEATPSVNGVLADPSFQAAEYAYLLPPPSAVSKLEPVVPLVLVAVTW